MSNELSKGNNGQTPPSPPVVSELSITPGSVSVKSDKTTIRMAIGLAAVCVLGWIFRDVIGGSDKDKKDK